MTELCTVLYKRWASFNHMLTCFELEAEHEGRPPEYLMAAVPSISHKCVTVRISLYFPLALTFSTH